MTLLLLYAVFSLVLLRILCTVTVCWCNTHQELQQSVGTIDTVNNFIHVFHWSLTKLLHHEENVD